MERPITDQQHLGPHGEPMAIDFRGAADPLAGRAGRRLRKRLLFGMIAALMPLHGVDIVLAQTGFYLQTDVGAAFAPPLTVHGSDNDWGTRCDLIINPLGVEVADECDTAPPLTSWKNELNAGSGIAQGHAVGYGWGPLRLEGEYFHRVTAYNDRVDTDIFDEVTLDKSEQEIEEAVGGVDDLQSHAVFANAYYDLLPTSANWTPYVGAGVGVERASLAYFSHWKRNDDPERITTFSDPQLRAKLAGATTIGRSRPTDTTFRYQLLAGLDYWIRDSLTLGVKFRWLPTRTFRGEPTEWDQLRSHESSVGRGDRILYEVMTDDNQLWGVSLSLKYWF